jgi:hypothetical protein
MPCHMFDLPTHGCLMIQCALRLRQRKATAYASQIIISVRRIYLDGCDK